MLLTTLKHKIIKCYQDSSIIIIKINNQLSIVFIIIQQQNIVIVHSPQSIIFKFIEMSRPKSAKLGVKQEYRQSIDESRQQQPPVDQNQQSIYRKNYKNRLLSANYKRTDRKIAEFGGGIERIVPHKMPQDRQRLYQETINLKKQIHSLQSQNLTLKTKLIKLETQNKKIEKQLENQNEDQFDRHKSRGNLGGIMGPQIESSKIPAMKRLVRETKDELEFLRQENQKIKRSVKYTRLTELENENKSLLDEMNKMVNIIDDLTKEERDYKGALKEVESLKAILSNKSKQNQSLKQKNQDIFYQLEEKQKELSQNHLKNEEKYKRYARQLDVNKRKLQIAQKQIMSLKTETNRLRNERNQANASSTLSTNNNNYAKKLIVKNNRTPISKVNVSNSKQLSQNYVSSNSVAPKTQSAQQALKDELSSLKKKNEQLQQQNNYLSTTIKEQEQKLLFTERSKADAQNTKQKDKDKEVHQQDYDQQNYDEDFQESFDNKKPTQQIKQKLIEDHSDGSEESILYQEDEQKNKPTKSAADEPKAKANKKGAHKKALTEIKALITYRLKAHRYPFELLQQQIQSTEDKEFRLSDVEVMLESQPFFLQKKQIKHVLRLLSPDGHKDLNSMVTIQVLIAKLRRLVEDFQLIDEEKEEEMLLYVSQVVTQHISQLQDEFNKRRNSNKNMTISEKSLRQLFSDFGLDKGYVDLIVAELSLESKDLEHLNYGEFLARFFNDDGIDGVEEVDQRYEDDYKKRIDEEQFEESVDSRSKAASRKKNGK